MLGANVELHGRINEALTFFAAAGLAAGAARAAVVFLAGAEFCSPIKPCKEKVKDKKREKDQQEFESRVTFTADPLETDCIK